MLRIVIFAAIIGFSLPVVGQGTIDKHGRYIPTPEEREASERMSEILRRPTLIRLRLVFLNPNTDEMSDVAPRYSSTDKVNIRIVLSHSFNDPITIVQSVNQYRDLQLELLRDGDVVAYKKETQQSINRALNEPPNESSAPIQFMPEKDYSFRRIDLTEWYKALMPGHYQLSVRLRFVWGGDWVQSDLITFDVSPGDKAKHLERFADQKSPSKIEYYAKTKRESAGPRRVYALGTRPRHILTGKLPLTVDREDKYISLKNFVVGFVLLLATALTSIGQDRSLNGIAKSVWIGAQDEHEKEMRDTLVRFFDS